MNLGSYLKEQWQNSIEFNLFVKKYIKLETFFSEEISKISESLSVFIEHNSVII